MPNSEYEPNIEEGLIRVSFYSYSADQLDILKYAIQWLEENKGYDLQDLVTAVDEGSLVTLYCKKR